MTSNRKSAFSRRVFSVPAAGLPLFWLLRTAAERQVFGPVHLFTFMQDGAFLPLPAALLAVCLLLCSFLFLTKAGQRCCGGMYRFFRTEGGLWLLSLIVTAVFVLWSVRVIVISYMTNDDVFYLQAVAKVPEQGLRAVSATFSHILFGGLLGSFYSLAPEGMWYIGYHLAVITFSLLLIGHCLLRKANGNAVSLLWGCAAHFALCAGMFLIAYAQVSFTVTPAAAGSAATALILCRHEAGTTGRRVVSDIVCILLMVLCYMQRSQTGLALLCFWGLAVVYQGAKLLTLRQGKRLIGLGITVLCVLALIFSLRYYQTANPFYDADYWNAEYYRSMVMDYIGGSLGAEQYAEAGIPQELAVLLHGWYFMDERVTTELFRTLVNSYYDSRSAAGGPAGLAAQLFTLAGQLRADPNMLWRTLAGQSALFMCAAGLIRRGRTCLPEFFCALAACGGACLMCLYLSAEGRFPLRAFLVPAIPAAVTALLMALTEPEHAPASPRRASGVLYAVCGAAFLLCCGFAAFHTPTAAEPIRREDLFTNQWVVEDFARKHPGITYVTNMYADNLDPFHSSRYPENLMLWGAMGDTARPADERMYADAFFREDVRFLCQNPAYVSFLLQYLTLDHGPAAALDEAHLTDAIYVYDLSRIAPTNGLDGWYDWNGARYYFENGAAVTGETLIDGVTYSFAAPGAASPMTVVSAPEGTYFTTGAYRLMEGGAE